MDANRQRNQGDHTHLSLFHTAVFLFYNFAMTSHYVMVTVQMGVTGAVIQLEGMFFILAYYLRTLDIEGAWHLLAAHVFSIIPIYTKFRIVSSMVLTVYSTLFPTHSFYISMLYLARLVVSAVRQMPYLVSLETAEGLHIYLCIAYIAQYYILHFNYRDSEDVVIGVVLLWTSLYFPNRFSPVVTILVAIIGYWIERKAQRYSPISTFPRRSLALFGF